MPEPMTNPTRRPEPARIPLPRNPSSVAAARRFIAARASAWSFPEPASEQLVLIGSELVTNAVLHARTELTLTLELRGDRVRISVKDRSKAPATLRHYRADALTGRGLRDGSFENVEPIELAGFDAPGHELRDVVLDGITVENETGTMTLPVQYCRGLTIRDLTY